jgi:hypothetical protein
VRRQFASELKQTNLKDLCALGGWKAAHTLLTCYVAPDPATQREALEKAPRHPIGLGFFAPTDTGNGHRQ